MQQEAIEHARFRAQSQIILDKEKGIEAFEEYMKIAFPYLAAAKKQERRDHIAKMVAEISRGPLVVRPVQAPTLRSRVSAAKNTRTRPQSPAEEKRLYRKIGRSI